MTDPAKFAHVMLNRIKRFFNVSRVCWYDIETFSECDLKESGSVVYAEHPSTEIFLGAWAFDNGPVHVWDKYAWTLGDLHIPTEIPDDLAEALFSGGIDTLVVCFNASFEYSLYKYCDGRIIPLERIMDPMINAYYLSFPGSLEKVGELVGLSEDQAKSKEGKALIRTFCTPKNPTKARPDRTRILPEDEPDKWRRFREYARQDVSSMRDAAYRLFQHPMPMHEWENWRMDFEMCDRGVPVNVKMAEAAYSAYEANRELLLQEMHERTGLSNPNSNDQLRAWLQASGQYVFDNLRKASVTRALTTPNLIPTDPNVLRVLQLRKAVSNTSATKFRKFVTACSSDGTIKHTIQFGGAQRTLRASGRLIQPQNLKKPNDHIAENMPAVAHDIETLSPEAVWLNWSGNDPMDTISMSVRGTIQAPEGMIFLDSDLSAIENVGVGWAAQEEKILNVFRNGQDPYLAFAEFMYRQPYEELWHEFKTLKQKKKRTVSKPAVLGCGYRLSAGKRYIDETSGEEEATGLLGYAKAMGIELTDEEAETSVRIWRETYSKVVQFWYDLEEAAKETLRTGMSHSVGPFVFDIKGHFMRILLPSGRHLHYFKAHLRKVPAPWDPDKLIENVAYYGLKDGAWVQQLTHGGKLTENIVQALARDLLYHGIKLANQEGLDVRLHVHDQILALTQNNATQQVERDLQILRECMSVRPVWAPDIPLNTGAVTATHFTKD